MKWPGLLILICSFSPILASTNINHQPLNPDSVQQKTVRSNDLCERVLSQNWDDLQVDGYSYSLKVTTNPFNPDQKYFELVTKKLKPDRNGFESDPSTGQDIEFSYQAGRDARTGGISARSEQGEIVFDVLLQHIKENYNGAVFLYIDVNSLNLVNHFKGKDGDGDLYLARVGHVIMDNLRDMDLLFRIGGDELAVLLPGASANNALRIMQRIQQALFKDKAANKIFEDQREYRLKQIRTSLVKMDKSDQDAVIKSLEKSMATSEEYLEMIKHSVSHPEVITKELANMLLKLDQERRLKPTVSMGAVFIEPHDDFDSLKLSASTIAGEVKVEYKMAVGLPIEKYEISVRQVQPGADYQAILPKQAMPKN